MKRTIIVLVMQSLDNSLTVRRKMGVFGERLTTRQGHGEPNPTWIPMGNEVTRRLASRIGGMPGGSVGEIVNIPMTAHIIGGCPIGDSADSGVLDAWQRVFGYDAGPTTARRCAVRAGVAGAARPARSARRRAR